VELGGTLEAALRAAMSTQTASEEVLSESRRAAARALGVSVNSRTFVCEVMASYFERMELDPRLLQRRVVHIAGTKGKGSTSAMCESILRASGLRTGASCRVVSNCYGCGTPTSRRAAAAARRVRSSASSCFVADVPQPCAAHVLLVAPTRERLSSPVSQACSCRRTSSTFASASASTGS
jgi:hypothetical protein